MKGYAIKLLAVAVLLAAAAGVASTQVVEEKPLLAWERVSFAAGLNYAWHAGPFEDSAPVPPWGREWETGLYAAYNLTPLLSLTGSSVYGFDNKLVESRVGLRVRLGRGD